MHAAGEVSESNHRPCCTLPDSSADQRKATAAGRPLPLSLSGRVGVSDPTESARGADPGPTGADTRQRPVRCMLPHRCMCARCTAGRLPCEAAAARREKKGKRTHASGQRHAWPMGWPGPAQPWLEESVVHGTAPHRTAPRRRLDAASVSDVGASSASAAALARTEQRQVPRLGGHWGWWGNRLVLVGTGRGQSHHMDGIRRAVHAWRSTVGAGDGARWPAGGRCQQQPASSAVVGGRPVGERHRCGGVALLRHEHDRFFFFFTFTHRSRR